MNCELCKTQAKKGVRIADIRMCDTCACKLIDMGELDFRDFFDAERL